MALLKQSTTYTRMFLLVQAADHVTGLTGATASVSLSKAGGAFASAGGTVTEVASGWYKIALTTTDTNTLGDLAFHITATSADPTDFTDQVVAVDLTDAVRLGLTALPNANAGASGGLPTVDANGRVSAAVGARKNTALSNFMFQMTDSTSHTPKTGLTNSSFVKEESIDGASGAGLSGTITEVDATNLPGIYKINLTGSELNGNVIALRFAASGCDDTEITIVTSA